MSETSIIIYDCDGVLFDSRGSNEAFYNDILMHFGLPPLQGEQLDFVHVSTAEEAIDKLFGSSPLREQAQSYRKTMDYRRFVPLMRMEPYLREVLARLRSDYHLAIATNRALSMPGVLEIHKLNDAFDLTVTARDVNDPKPHPECLWKILMHFQADPLEAIYIGDAEVDQMVSERAGVPFAAYKNPMLKADYYLSNHLDLLNILKVDTN